MLKPFKLALIAAVFLEIVIFASAASYAQQDRRDLVNRLNQMDNQIQTLSQAVFKGGVIPQKTQEDYEFQTMQAQASPADIEVRLSQLEREIRALTGRVETVAHDISKVEDQLMRKINDLELRIQDMEGGPPRSETTRNAPVYNAPQPIQGRDNRTPDDTQQGAMQAQRLGTLPGGTETETLRQLPIDMYETAFAKLKDGQYEEAETSFREFIAENPEHRLVSNARYWLGETFYVRENYEQAARAFARGYKENPSGAKAPDNLLKLGLALDGLGNREDACVALIQLTQKFPDGPRPVLNRAAQEIERLDCSR